MFILVSILRGGDNASLCWLIAAIQTSCSLVEYFVHIELGKHKANTQLSSKGMAFVSNELKFLNFGQTDKICCFKFNWKENPFTRAWYGLYALASSSVLL